MASEAELTDTIQRIKAALLALGDLRPGALSEQYNTCRTPAVAAKPTRPSATAHTISSATATTDEAAPRTSAPNTSTRSTPRSPTTANCANSSTNGSTPPSNSTASDAAHPDNGHGHKPKPGAPSPQTDMGDPASSSNPRNTGPSGPSMPIYHRLTLG